MNLFLYLHCDDDDEEDQDNGPHQAAQDAHKVVFLLSPKKEKY